METQTVSLQFLSEKLSNPELTMGEEGRKLLLELLDMIEGDGHEAYKRVRKAWMAVRALGNKLACIQDDLLERALNKDAADCREASDKNISIDLHVKIFSRDKIRKDLRNASQILVSTLEGGNAVRLTEYQRALDRSAKALATFLERWEEEAQRLQIAQEKEESNPTLVCFNTTEDPTDQCKETILAVSEWVNEIAEKLSSTEEKRKKVARSYAASLRQLALILEESRLDHSTNATNTLSADLQGNHVALEAAIAEEKEILTDSSLVKKFPFDTLLSALRDGLHWTKTTSFMSEQLVDVRRFQADLQTLRNLKDPESLLDARKELKDKKINEMMCKEIDLKSEIDKSKLKKQPTQGIETELAEVREQIRSAVKELEGIDGELWSLISHFPEHAGKMKDILEEQGVGSGDLPICHEKIGMFQVMERVAQVGCLGARHSVIRVSDGQEEYIIKEYGLSDSEKERKCFLREARILRRLEHPYIVKLSSAFIEAKHEHGTVMKGYLKMPVAIGGTLWSWMQQVKPSDQQKHRVLLQILQGLEHLRQNRIVHCDIKPANILMSSQNEHALPQIADFDVSKEQEDRAREFLAATVTATIAVGTLAYMAPELINMHSRQGRVSHKSDMYSYGVLMLEFLTESPTRGIQGDDTPRLLNGLQGYAKDLISKLIIPDPNNRLSSIQALTHPYFSHAMLVVQDQFNRETSAVFNPPAFWQCVMTRVKINVTAQWKEKIQELMTSTCKQQYVGQRRQGKGLKYTGFQVERVFRIENQDLWSGYAQERSRIMQQGKCHPETQVSTWRDWMEDELLVDKASNEVFLFHGTSFDMADVILTSGFDERVCNLNGLFGAGIYLAENSSKSDEYCVPDSQDICRMFLVRSALGTPFEAEKSMQRARRPPTNPTGVLYDSVIGVTKETHPAALLQWYREFIVYYRRQTYPEFLIEFKRV